MRSTLFNARTEHDRASRPGGRAARLSCICSEAVLVVQAWAALLVANLRYWRTVAPVADARIAHWRSHAEAIPDQATRELALSKLDGERFNAEAGAMLATFAPAGHRAKVVEAIVALQLLFDLLDGLTERTTQQPIEDGQRLFALFTGALGGEPSDGPEPSDPAADYMRELAEACRRALAELPATGAVIESAQAAAARAAAAQIHMHAAAKLGVGQLQSWAHELSSQTSLPWRELTAGAASSVLCVHALIAAAANPATTPAQAAQIDWAYLSICVLLTLLDSLIDRDQDHRDSKLGYVGLYDDSEQLGEALDASLARAGTQVRRLPDPARHLMMLAAVVAYYASAPAARAPGAAENVARLTRGLQPVIAPTLLLMRLWRLRRRRQGRV
jgi:tetraprenyl-beta-curcumene synthase